MKATISTGCDLTAITQATIPIFHERTVNTQTQVIKGMKRDVNRQQIGQQTTTGPGKGQHARMHGDTTKSTFADTAKLITILVVIMEIAIRAGRHGEVQGIMTHKARDPQQKGTKRKQLITE